MRPRVVITGIGVKNPLGSSPHEIFRRLCDGGPMNWMADSLCLASQQFLLKFNQLGLLLTPSMTEGIHRHKFYKSNLQNQPRGKYA